MLTVIEVNCDDGEYPAGVVTEMVVEPVVRGVNVPRPSELPPVMVTGATVPTPGLVFPSETVSDNPPANGWMEGFPLGSSHAVDTVKFWGPAASVLEMPDPKPNVPPITTPEGVKLTVPEPEV